MVVNMLRIATINTDKLFLAAQLISNAIDVTDSLNHSFTGRLARSAISSLFVDRNGRYLRFCHLEFDEKVISVGFMAHSSTFWKVGGDFKVI